MVPNQLLKLGQRWRKPPETLWPFWSAASGESWSWATVSMKNGSLGQWMVGLQPQASDGVTETSLANTGGVVTPGLPILLGYVERGWFMRRDDGVLSGLRFARPHEGRGEHVEARRRPRGARVPCVTDGFGRSKEDRVPEHPHTQVNCWLHCFEAPLRQDVHGLRHVPP